MPTLNWIGKDKVINHHLEVPFHTLDKQYTVGDSDSGNKIINGDNLVALKALLPEYEGKIKCIYIDPPYNTGNEGWIYNDNVNAPQIKRWLGQVVGKEGEDLSRHDKWLCMMYPRLQLLHKLLADDGAIFISIDDNEQANLKLLCDEIFGEGNFIMTITWRRTDNQTNIGKFAKVAEYILIYSKNYNICNLGRLPLSEKAISEYQYEDKKGKYGRGQLRDAVRGKHNYIVTTPDGFICNGPWFVSKEEFDNLVRQDLIHWPEKEGGTPRKKIYLQDMLDKGQIPNNFWGIEFGTNQRAANQLEQMFKKRVFDFSKPTSLIENIISIGSTDKSSIILDSFAGSGTTAHAVLNLNKKDGGNRKFILVEMEDYAETITAERVKRVINGYGEGDKAVEGTGGGFDYFSLGKTIFNADGNLNEDVGVEKIREYIWYSETGTSISSHSNDYFLGSYNATDYYFYYEQNEETILTRENIGTIIKQKAEGYIIYADACQIEKKFMETNNITFKRIPRDIKKL